MSFKIEVVSEPWSERDYEIWTCQNCGWSVALAGVGGDIACCPECERRTAEKDYAFELVEEVCKGKSDEFKDGFFMGILYSYEEQRKRRKIQELWDNNCKACYEKGNEYCMNECSVRECIKKIEGGN